MSRKYKYIFSIFDQKTVRKIIAENLKNVYLQIIWKIFQSFLTIVLEINFWAHIWYMQHNMLYFHTKIFFELVLKLFQDHFQK
jgi:hypothetical protein